MSSINLPLIGSVHIPGTDVSSSEASDVTISNGRIYIADGAGGLVFFK